MYKRHKILYTYSAYDDNGVLSNTGSGYFMLNKRKLSFKTFSIIENHLRKSYFGLERACVNNIIQV